MNAESSENEFTPSQETRDVFGAHVREVQERQRANSTAYDQAILALSTAGLGLSVSFTDRLIPLAGADCIGLLGLAWVSFVLSIVLTVASFLVSQYALTRHLGHAEQYYLRGKDEFFNKKTWLDHATIFLNLSSGINFVLAIGTFTAFAMINLLEK